MTIGKYPSNLTTVSPGSIGTTELADSSVTTAKVADGAIINADINASAAIALSKLATTGTITADTVIAPVMTAGNASTPGLLSVGDGTTNYTIISQPEIAGNLFLNLPTTAGSANNVLKTDGSGNLSWTSNVATATALQTPRTINGTSFDGTASITVPCAAGTLTGTTLSTGVSASSLTSFAPSPTLVTPLLGTPTSGTLTNCTGYPVANIANLASGAATFLTTPSSANLATLLTDETGTGANVFATSPTLVTPILGTPTSGTLTNCTGLPQTGIGATVFVRADTPTSTVTSSQTDITTWTSRVDTNSAFVASTGVFTAPTSGVYAFNCSFDVAATYSVNNTLRVDFCVNGSAVYSTFDKTTASAGTQAAQLSIHYALAANDTVKFKIGTDGTGASFSGSGAFNWLTICKVGN